MTTDGIPLLIIGAGDHGRGTLEIVRACNRVRPSYNVLGFLDDACDRPGEVSGVPVLGGIDRAISSHPAVQYVIAIAGCAAKQRVAEHLDELGVSYTSVVHPAATLSPDVELGPGAIIGAGVVIAYATRLRPHVTVNLNATVGHDCEVGAFSTVAPGANIAGHVRIGSACDIGLNSTVTRGITIGDRSIVGPGAVVLKSLPCGSRVFGNPARAVPS